MKNNRGEAVTTVILVLALCAVGGVMAGWRPMEVFRPKPPTEELTRLQGQLVANQAAAEQARKDAVAAVTAERAKLEQEIRVAQQDNAGTVAALGKVPPPHRTAEVKLAGSMAQRVTLKLAAAIGALPLDQQAAMVQLIEQALSDKQAEVDEANRKLAERDAAFAVLAKERDTIKAQIPILEGRAAKAEETVKATESKVTAKTNEVKVIADKLDGEKRERGSLGTALNRVIFWACVVGGLWVFLAFILPSIVKVMGTGPFKDFLRNVSGLFLNPVLYWDAKKKINDLAETNAKITNSPFPPK